MGNFFSFLKFSIDGFCSNQNETIISFIREPSNNFAKKSTKGKKEILFP